MSMLRTYFKNREEVLMSFLFGSWSKDCQNKESDIDIAVYIKPQHRHIEFEDEKAKYAVENDLWADLEGLLKREVDLIILNRASSTISDSALRGVPILIRDRKVYLNFMLRATAEAEDFRNFVEDYWKLKQEIWK
jgi:predicted nucleotidyltransferase